LPMSAGLLAFALLAPLLVRRFGPRTVLTCAMMLIVIASAVIATSAANRSFFLDWQSWLASCVEGVVL
jgi:Na+/melibiose symporter-like transporter